MPVKQRKTELFRIFLKKNTTGQDFEDIIILQKLIEDFFKNNLYKAGVNNKTFKVDEDRICWIESYEKTQNLIKVTINYIVHNKNVDIRSVKNLLKTGHKTKSEGDVEKQHFVIKFYPRYNQSVIAFENTLQGISIKFLELTLKEYIDEQLKNKLLISGVSISIFAIPDGDFLDELMNMERISLLKITVDSEKVTQDEDILFSGDNELRKEHEIIYKPIPRGSFSKKKLKKYYESFLKNQSKKEKIKRITIDGVNTTGKIKLDTNEARLHQYIKVNLNNDGVISSFDIFQKYVELLNVDLKDYLRNIIIS